MQPRLLPRARARARARARRGARASLPAQTHPRDRRLRAGRRAGHTRARDRAKNDCRARATGRDRQSRGRERRHRRGNDRQGRGRWLHAVSGDEHGLRDAAAPEEKHAVRRAQGLCLDHAARVRLQRARRQPRRGGEKRSGTATTRESEAGRPELWIGRQRQSRARGGRNAQCHGQRAHDACAVQRRGARAAGRHRRAGATHHNVADLGGAAHHQRQSARTGHHRQQAQSVAAGFADRRRDPAGIRNHAMVGGFRRRRARRAALSSVCTARPPGPSPRRNCASASRATAQLRWAERRGNSTR